MECSGLILCEETSVDSTHSVLSVKNIVNHLFIELTVEEEKEGKGILRFTKLPLEVVSIWRRLPGVANEAEKFEYQLEFISPSGKNLIENAKADVTVAEKQLSFYSTLRFNDGLPCDSGGVYFFKVILQGLVVHEIAFPIVMRDAKGNGTSV